LSGGCFLRLVKFEFEKLKLGLKLRIIVCLLCSCCSIFKVLLIFILFREVIVIIQNAAIIEGLLRDHDFSLIVGVFNILSQLL
jgi:hypothetical protein